MIHSSGNRIKVSVLPNGESHKSLSSDDGTGEEESPLVDDLSARFMWGRLVPVISTELRAPEAELLPVICDIRRLSETRLIVSFDIDGRAIKSSAQSPVSCLIPTWGLMRRKQPAESRAPIR